MEGDFRIGDWLVQPLRDVIESADQCVQLEPKAMDLLVYLAEHQGEVILKELLIQAVWPDAFVTDEVLTNNIWKLRQAFGDDPKNPKIIQTVPRRGYQLIAEVVWVEASDEKDARYEIGGKIGQGAMGEVYLAEDTVLKRKVALKFVREEMDQEASWQRHLVREARSAAALDHPFICKVYDTGQLDGRIFIAMEYVKGESLKELLKQGPLPLEQALQVAREAAEALESAHDGSLVHRDIKPSNIMLTEQGHLKVMDFGVAKKLPTTDGDQEWTATLTTDASSMGTLPYMSPEQIRGQAVDPRSDIFSLGVVLYEMLTGVHPFRKPLSADTAAATLNEEPAALSLHRKPFPVGLQGLLGKMLAKERDDRYQSIQDVLLDLSRLTSQKESIFPVEFLKRNGKKLALTALVLVVVTSAAVMTIWRPWETPTTSSPTRPSPLTSYLGVEGLPALSPDGGLVAFAWDGKEQDNSDIYVLTIGTAEPHQLTTDSAEDSYPTWSPDGSRIAFLRNVSDAKHSVFVRPVLGGSEEWLADSSFVDVGYGSGGLSWSPVEDVIAMVDRTAPDEPNSIFLLSLETQEKRRLSSPPEGAWDDWPRFSPDGSTVAFLRFGPVQSHICTQDVRGGEAKYLMSSPQFVRGLEWTSDGSALVVSLSEMFSQDSYLSRVPLAGGEPEQLSFGEGAEWVSIARTGGRLAYDLIQYTFDIWRVSGPNSSEIVSPTRFPASSNRVESLPEYSPDGSKIAFVSGRSGDTEIWQCDADGTQLQQLTRLGLAWLGEWSPSGDRIAFCASEGEEVNWDILVINNTGGLPRNLTHDEFDDACPSWSPDGQWIYYHSLRGGDRQICRVSSKGGATVQLTENGGLGPRVGEDGQVYFWRNERIWSLPRDENGGEESLALDKKVNSFLNWCTWEDNIVYISREGGREPSIEMFNLTSGVTKKLHSLGEGMNPANGLTVSPDGWWILFTQFEFSADLMLVENFN